MKAGRTHAGARQRLAAVLALVLSGAFIPAQPAAAQDFFTALFGGYNEEPARSSAEYRSSYAPSYEDRRQSRPVFRARRERSESRSDEPRESHRSASSASNSGGGATNCVRMCDGRYFPLPHGTSRANAANVCTALCPKAETKVFNGGDMEHAVATDGTRYSSLPNAFAFRQKIVSDCSCTGHGPGGLAQINVESDPTLRVGDVVVQASGPTIFNGASQLPYKAADFTPVKDYGKLNDQLRRVLSEVRVNPNAKSVIPVQTVEVASKAMASKAMAMNEDRPAARPHRRRAVVRQQAAAPVREANFFDMFR